MCIRDRYVAFVDLEKVDTISRTTLWGVLQKFGCPDNLLQVIRNLNLENTARVTFENGCSEPFNVECGVRQGCVLAPTLFIAYVNAVLHIVDSKLISRSVCISYRTYYYRFATRGLPS